MAWLIMRVGVGVLVVVLVVVVMMMAVVVMVVVVVMAVVLCDGVVWCGGKTVDAQWALVHVEEVSHTMTRALR